MRTRPMQRLYLSFVLLLVLAVALSACVAPAAPTASAPAAGDAPAAAPAPAEAAMPHVLKVANTANITTWDPVASFSTEAAYMANMYEQLLRINPPGSAEMYTPLLATSWTSNEDGTAWTFSLRDGVTFHDGEALTADAVKMSIEAGSTQGGASFIWWALDTIEVVDDLTVTFNFTSPTPMDLVASSLYGSWIISPKALEAAAADEGFWEMGVEAGTGPYMLESYIPDQEILLTAFPDYWGGWSDGQFDTVLVQIVPEAVLQQQMLEGGEVDLVTRIPQENYATFEGNPDYSVLVEPSFFNYVGLFNTLRAPLDNPMVRQALSYAIPYEDIITIGAQGLGSQSRGPVPAGVWPWSADVPQYTYDVAKAKELLAAAGYPDGGFSMRLTYAAENATEEAFAPLIKDAFAAVGVDVSIEPLLFSQQWELSKADPANAQDMFLLLYWPTYSDAGTDNLYSMFHSSAKPFFNLSYWVNEEFDSKIDEAAALTVNDRATAQTLYTEAMTVLVDEAPGLFFFDTQAIFIVPSYIQGFQYNLNYPFVQHFYYDLTSSK
ncbi:MAG: ABC transporter substrate-binding protein [Caldilineaceae bacterium]|nr:ABC transporter substrate-binding protein [Caldilineaceae bacterium]MBP8106840.1 ABC transporter substrate-binding protein [Caldilineaceae bacterium]MBP8121734.1 ABC transporter substrate-binding protein [Caldilineaceae bacterium]MBP9071476.1 ABC transporter substrate-binding protein [Caldilineaceae bacterium]